MKTRPRLGKRAGQGARSHAEKKHHKKHAKHHKPKHRKRKHLHKSPQDDAEAQSVALPVGPPASPPAPSPTPVASLGAPISLAQAHRLLWRAGFGPAPGQAEALAGQPLSQVVYGLTRPSGSATLSGPEPTEDEGHPLAPYRRHGGRITAGGWIAWCALISSSSSG